MDCKEACRKIRDYLERNLDIEEVEKFLAHMKECPDCYEELELYFTLDRSLKQLDSDDFQVGDMKKALEEDIREQSARVSNHYRMLILRYIGNTLAFLCVAAAFCFQFRLWMDAGLF